MSHITYTSTMDQEIWDTVSEVAAKYKISKKQIIESSVQEYLFKLKQEEFSEGFKNLANDQEMIEMADMGMEDYFNQLSKL